MDETKLSAHWISSRSHWEEKDAIRQCLHATGSFPIGGSLRKVSEKMRRLSHPAKQFLLRRDFHQWQTYLKYGIELLSQVREQLAWTALVSLNFEVLTTDLYYPNKPYRRLQRRILLTTKKPRAASRQSFFRRFTLDQVQPDPSPPRNEYRNISPNWLQPQSVSFDPGEASRSQGMSLSDG